MEIRDYNGTGEWSRDQIEQRYRAYCAQYGISARDLAPREHQEGPIRWVYPIMDRVIDGAKEGDLACVQLCLELIQQDQGFPFGMVLKSQAARALRRCVGCSPMARKNSYVSASSRCYRGATPRGSLANMRSWQNVSGWKRTSSSFQRSIAVNRMSNDSVGILNPKKVWPNQRPEAIRLADMPRAKGRHEARQPALLPRP